MKYPADYSRIYYPVADRPQGYIDTFKTRYESFDTRFIYDIFQEQLGQRPQSVERSTSWGSSHVIYFVTIANRKLVFRANSGLSSPEEPMLAEKVITDKLAELGIPVNKILVADISRAKYAFDYQIEEVFAGNDLESLWDQVNNDQELYDKISFQLGALIAKMSGLKTEKFGLFAKAELDKGDLVGYQNTFSEFLELMLEQNLKAQVGMFISADQVDQIYKLFTDRKVLINSLEPGIVHHDLADHNIAVDLHTGKITALFDWESACSGHALLDLASCPTWRILFPRKDILLDGYRSIKQLPDNWQEIFNLLKLRTIIWKDVFAVRAGILRREYITRLEDALSPFGIKPKTDISKLAVVD